MLKKIRWALFALLAISIGLYPALYFILDRKFSLLSNKTDALLADPLWNVGFYTHILGGGVALLIGWLQFSKKLRNRYLPVHRAIGKVYVTSALLSALGGIYIGFFATGGMVSAAGFISLGVIWFYTTLQAYLHIRNKDSARHQVLMIYSYAACFAAVTLRLWMPLLIAVFQDFIPAYRVVAWLCWAPNLAVAHYFWVRPLRKSR